MTIAKAQTLGSNGSAPLIQAPSHLRQFNNKVLGGASEQFTIPLKVGQINTSKGEAYPVLLVFSPTDQAGTTAFGPGWRMPLLESLLIATDEKKLGLIDIDGSQTIYFAVKDKPGEYKNSFGDQVKMIDNRAELIWRDGTRALYSKGRMERMITPGGATLSLQAKPNGDIVLMEGSQNLLSLAKDLKAAQWQLTLNNKQEMTAIVGERPLIKMEASNLSNLGMVPTLVAIMPKNGSSKLLDLAYGKNPDGQPSIKNLTEGTDFAFFKEVVWYPGKAMLGLNGTITTDESFGPNHARRTETLPSGKSTFTEQNAETGWSKQKLEDGTQIEAWNFGDVGAASGQARKKIWTFPDKSVQELKNVLDEKGEVIQTTIINGSHKTEYLKTVDGSSGLLIREQWVADGYTYRSRDYDPKTGKTLRIKGPNVSIEFLEHEIQLTETQNTDKPQNLVILDENTFPPLK